MQVGEFVKYKEKVYHKSKYSFSDGTPLYSEYKGEDSTILYSLTELKGYIEVDKPYMETPIEYECTSLQDILQSGTIIEFEKFTEEYYHDYKHGLIFKDINKVFGLDNFLIFTPNQKPRVTNVSYSLIKNQGTFKVLGKRNGKYLISSARKRIKFTGKVITVKNETEY